MDIMKFIKAGYQSPSADHLNWNSFKARRFTNTCGPFPVIMKGRYAGFEKKQWFNYNRATKRHFEVYYGYNPRCFRKGGMWRKPGSFFWRKYES